MKLIYCLMIFFCPLVNTAQTAKALTIGDRVPDIKLANLINYKTGTAHLSDFNSGLLILDFWATWCSGCLNNFSKMQALEKEFKGRLQVLPVTDQSSEKIRAFLDSKAGQQYHIISVTGDTVLRSLFPHRLIPHLVWISKEGRVVAITSADEVNEASIRGILNRQTFALIVKKDLPTNRPLFMREEYPPTDDLLYYSIFSKGYYPGLGSGTVLRREGSVIRGRAFTNEVLINMYEAVMYSLFSARHDTYSQKRRIIRVKDSSEVLLTRGDYGLYSTANAYNFDIMVPVALADSLYPFILRDLNRYSNFIGSIQKREEWCLVLRRVDSTDKLKTRGGKKQNTLFYKKPSCLTNYPLSFLVNELNSLQTIPLPVIDETGYGGQVDIELSGATGLQTIRSELLTYGLELVKEKRVINMFVLTDKK
ncbi:MAG: TlpA family protein disulfide reductase [Ginsengibacter sp.]